MRYPSVHVGLHRRPSGLRAAVTAVRILGIDPGLRITGFGVIDKAGQHARLRHQRLHPDAAARACPSASQSSSTASREVIATHRPAQVALEKVFVNVNPQSTLLLGQARGTAICAAVLARLPVAEYTALQVKQAVVGNGHARKEQVQEMVTRLLQLARRARAPTPPTRSPARSATRTAGRGWARSPPRATASGAAGSSRSAAIADGPDDRPHPGRAAREESAADPGRRAPASATRSTCR